MKNFIKALFSIENQSSCLPNNLVRVHKKITILGIKTKLKLYEYYLPNKDFANFFEKYIYYNWITQKNDNKFIDLVELMVVINSGQSYSQKIDLILLSTLIEIKSFVQAEYALERYMERYGLDLIHEYLLVSKFIMTRNLPYNNLIENSSKLFDILNQNEIDEKLNKFIANKTVAVVGNGCSAIGSGKQEEIDSHDIVVRFNNFSTDINYVPDYGEKTDIWMVVNNFDFADISTRNLENLSILWIACEICHQTYPKEYVSKILELHSKYNFDIVCRATNSLKTVIENSKLRFPSSGLCALSFFKSQKNIKKLDVYGFGFQNLKNFEENILNRYYENRPNSFMGHNFYKEAIILSEMFSN